MVSSFNPSVSVNNYASSTTANPGLINKDTIDSKDSQGLTKLMSAVIDNNLDEVDRLVSAGAHLEIVTDLVLDDGERCDKVTALQIAAILGNREMITKLVSLGAKLRSVSGSSAMVAFGVGPENDDTTRLLFDLHKTNNESTDFEKVS